MARLLHHWLVFSLTALVVAPVVLVVMVLHLTLLPGIRHHVEQENQTLGAAVTSEVHNTLRLSAQGVVSIGREIADMPYHLPRLQDMLDALPLTDEAIAAVYLLDKDYRVRKVGLPTQASAYREDFINLDFSTRAFVAEARRTGQMVWSDSYLSSRGQITAAIALPLGDRLLVGEIELHKLSDVLKQIADRGRILAFIVDKQGHVVAHPDASKSLQQVSVRQNPLVQAGIDGTVGSANFDMDGVSYYGSAAIVDDLGWIVVVGQDVRSAQATENTLQLVLGIGGLATLVIAMVAALLLARYLLRRMNEFGRHLHAVASGDYAAPIPQSRITELNDLADSMRTMANAVLERERKLSLAATVFESGAEGICITDVNQMIISANQALCTMTGYPAEELVGQTPAIFKSGRHDRTFYQHMWHEIDGRKHWSGEVWNRRKNGEIFPVWLGISTVRDENDVPTHYIGTAFDISDRKSAEEQISFLAQHDALTKLPNQTLLLDRIGQALSALQRKECRAGVLLLDLDRFKLVNDTLGHDVGDRLLEQVAERLRQILRQTETIARLGGDEFVVFVPEVDSIESLSLVAQKIVEALSVPYLLGDSELQVTPSIGISVAPDDGEDPRTLMRNADAAMYHAKDLGRNNFQFFAQTMNVVVRERLSIENDLRRALEHGEFVLFYQPQVNCRTGQVTGMEALIRWQHPRRGMVPPNDFIQVAEETGIIVQIGAWVLREACLQARIWHDQGLDIRIGVNLSARQFGQADLMSQVNAAIAVSGIDPHLLELEITESMLMEDPMAAAEVLRQISAMGIRLAVDDFGTGYSSLAYLKRFPLQRLKIDRSFVRDISTDPNDAAIVSAIVAMAESLHMEVIAEGVEEVSQLHYLDRVGCCSIQGYLFSKPKPADQIVQFSYPVPMLQD